MNPTSNSRGRARNASRTPYTHVNAIKNLPPNLQEIIKDCPALDVIFDNDTRRSSTRNRARKKDHVPRPPNAFMVYRSYAWHTKQLEDNKEKNLSCVSRLVARTWHGMDDQARDPFKQVADIAKREHAVRHPDYKYAPSSRSQTSPKKPARRASKAKVKVKVKVKVTATHGNAGSDSLPLLKEAAPTPASTPPASSEHSYSPFSSPSPSPPSTPPTPIKRQWTLNLPPSSPELRYPCDHDHTDPPPRPRVRPVTSGLIPSPSMSVLHLNDADAHTLSILDELPDKYKEAESYHDLQPHALLYNEGIPFDGAKPNTQISVRPVPVPEETVDYSSYISGNPEVNLGSPIVNPTPGWCFPGPSNTTTDDDLNSTLKWPVFDIPTLDFDGIVDEPNMYSPHDDDLFEAVITYDDY